MKKNYFITGTLTFLIALILVNCNGGEGNKEEQNKAKDGVHKGTFTNRNQQQAKDLHIVFDAEGVTYDASESRTRMTSHEPVNKDGKTQIDLDGDINQDGSAFGQVFKRKAGDFKIEKWWWTIKEGDKSVMLGQEHIGPPSGDNGAWE